MIAGVTFIQEACKTRKNVLDQVLTYCLNILYTPEDSRSPRLKDGALHTIGSIATVLLRVSNVFSNSSVGVFVNPVVTVL